MVWTILGIIGALIVGFLLGVGGVLVTFKKQVTTPGSNIRKMLDSHIDQQEVADVEMFAQGAEMYQSTSACQKQCGLEIAEMFRANRTQRGKKVAQEG